MKSITRIVFVGLVIAVAPVPAFADSCPASIVVGNEGGRQQLGYFNNATIQSAAIPTQAGVKYQCVFESQYGMIPRDYGLNANQLIQSVGTGWQSTGSSYTCGQVGDCSFVVQTN